MKRFEVVNLLLQIPISISNSKWCQTTMLLIEGRVLGRLLRKLL